MGINFHKSVKVDDNTRINIGKKSASVSVGKKGIRHTVSTSGKSTTTIGIPGTGLSYTMSSGGKTGSKKKTSGQKKRSSTIKTAVAVLCSAVAVVLAVIAVCSYFGGKTSGGGLEWRKDEYSVAAGKTATVILDVKDADGLSNAKAQDFEITVDNEDAVEVSFKEAYSETVHFTVEGKSAGAASVKISYKGKESNALTVNVN